MIRLEPVDRDGFDQFVIEADEPVAVEVTALEGRRVIAHVYRGTDIDEYSEPIGAFDGTLPENTPWEVNGDPGITFEEAKRQYEYWQSKVEDWDEKLVERWDEAGRPGRTRWNSREVTAFYWNLSENDFRGDCLSRWHCAARSATWREIMHRLCPGHDWERIDGPNPEEPAVECTTCGQVDV